MRVMMTNLSEYLKEKRVATGMSQLDVAKALGYSSPQFVSNWERGLVAPPLETVGILIDLYKLSSDDVINRILDETRTYLKSQLGGKKKKASRRSR